MTTNTDQAELLPCPFCGSQDVSQSIGKTASGKDWPYIECHECAACAEPNIWNRRTPHPVSAQWYDEWEEKALNLAVDYAKAGVGMPEWEVLRDHIRSARAIIQRLQSQ